MSQLRSRIRPLIFFTYNYNIGPGIVDTTAAEHESVHTHPQVLTVSLK
jgi:hypothetical protein